MSDIRSLEPKIVWEQFYNLTQVPRPSKNEGKAVDYLINFAKKHNFEYQTDNFGNVIIRKPAIQGKENSPSIVIQNHIDMVCEKNDGTIFDFNNDSIKTLIDGDWVTADGTTLGADNGIGAAMGLSILLDEKVKHGPIEVLFTTDEESGMTGAIGLGSDLIKSKLMLNLDTEEEGAIYIGCAGGKTTIIEREFEPNEHEGSLFSYEVTINGLKGGHSGLMIHYGLGNAIKLAGRLISHIIDINENVYISSIVGGEKHNAIPREAKFIISFEDNFDLEKVCSDFTEIFKKELKGVDEGILITSKRLESAPNVMCRNYTKLLKNLIMILPHGVGSFSNEVHGLVETSTNLASINMQNYKLRIVTSQRSFVKTKLDGISAKVRACGLIAGCNVTHSDGYPSWQPNSESPLLKKAGEVHKEIFGKSAEIKAIHAGLECGLLSEKYPEMDIISIGPDITGAHSPDERVKISSVGNIYKFVKGIIEAY